MLRYENIVREHFEVVYFNRLLKVYYAVYFFSCFSQFEQKQIITRT
jgi:hypothetical protein